VTDVEAILDSDQWGNWMFLVAGRNRDGRSNGTVLFPQQSAEGGVSVRTR